MPKMPKRLENAKEAKNANQFQGANTMSATTKAYSITMAGAKKGGRRWAPRGVTIE